MKNLYAAAVLSAVVASPVAAADILGSVRSMSSEYATVVTKSDQMPSTGDKAVIFYKMAGVYAEISVAKGHVHEITGRDLVLKIDKATGTVSKNQLVRFISAGTTKVTSPSPAASPGPGDPDMARGAQEFAKGDWNAAIASYSAAIKTNRRNGQAYFQRARCHFRTGNNDAAIADCSSAIPLLPVNFSEVFVLRGGAYGKKKNFAAALADYQKAAELDPRSARIRTFCGLGHFGLKDFKAALQDYDKAIELDPKFAEAYYRRGFARQQLNDAPGAIADWEKAIQLTPSYAKKLTPKIEELRSAEQH